MHRFFFEKNALIENTATLSPEESRHAAQVLRLKPGAQVVLLDGHNVYSAVILSADVLRVTARITGMLPDNEPKTRITLYQGLPKADKMEWIAQKSTELGVHAIQPVLFSRCDRDGKNSEKIIQRCQRIVCEAVKQCGRGFVPTVARPVSFQEILPMIRSHAQAFVAWEGEQQLRIADLSFQGKALDVAVVIGPEGGIAREEIDQLASAGARMVTLGARILRTETAGIVALASIFTLTGE